MTNAAGSIRWIVLVACGQFLYSSGAAVTSGSFLTYFVKLWSPSATLMAWFFVLPELVHTGSCVTAGLIRWLGSAKRVWLLFALFSRIVLLTVSFVGWSDPSAASGTSLAILLTVVAIGELAQAISYVALVSWLSEIFDRDRWGQVFGWRQFAIVTAMMTLPPVAAAIREWLAGANDPSGTSYATLFLAANVVVLAGIALLSRLPQDNRIQVARNEHLIVPIINRRFATFFAIAAIVGFCLRDCILPRRRGLRRPCCFFTR